LNKGSVLLKLDINQIIERKPAGTDKIKDNEYCHIDKCQFSFRKKTVMYVKEGNSHGNYHRQNHYSEEKAGNKKERTAEFGKNSQHKGHIAAKSENTRICKGQLRKIHHLAKTMNKEHYTEKESENKDKGRYALSSEMLGKQKIVKHNSSINLSESSFSNSLPMEDKCPGGLRGDAPRGHGG
jgi:hypothetical protein